MDLAAFPLAKLYGWVPPREDTGGIMYVYPPIRAKNTRERIFTMDLDSALAPSIRAEVDHEHRLGYNVAEGRKLGVAKAQRTKRAKKSGPRKKKRAYTPLENAMRRGGRKYSVPSSAELGKMNTHQVIAVARDMGRDVELRGSHVRVVGRGQMTTAQFRKWVVGEARAIRAREKVGEV